MTGAHERVRGALVVAQVSVGLVLLCGASILGAGFLHLTRRDLGFRPDNLLTFRIELPGARYTTDRQIEFIDRLLERLEAVPGVTSATVGMPLPLTGNEMCDRVQHRRASNRSERAAILEHGARIARATSGPSAHPSSMDANSATTTTGASASADRQQGVRGQVLSRRQCHRQSASTSGATSNRDAQGGGRVFREIVGVAGNARQSTGGRDPEPIYYFPYKQMPWGPPSVIVRTTLPAATILPDVRHVVAALDPQVPVHGVKTMTAMFASGMAAPRFLTMLMSSFAAIGLLLTATGLYGLLSYAVSRRTREIGVRMALGASRRSIVSLILGRAMTLIAIGTALGGLGMLAAQAVLKRMLFALDAPHPLAWLFGAAAIVALTAVAAAYPPAMRAASIDPTTALRAE